ncbi:hypothetical protein F4779DRAFT_586208 [Xylariaceae sp. FL0662B]|nr:hypothetical protein F4779DRAFT_586208 [Xylariaceae sp. FL0662B]
MLEPWDEVLTLQRERQLCADDVQNIKTSCAIDHGKRHPVECSECWTRLINRMRDRYLNSATKEWFSGRRPFLLELDTMFSKAHDHGFDVDFKTIEQRILAEKKEWYRDKLRNLGLQGATKSASEARILQQRINDRSITTDELASHLREAFSDGAIQNEEAFNGFLERLKLADSPKSRYDAYIDIFFQPDHDPTNAARSRKYIEMVRNGIPIADAMNSMLRDRQSAKGDQDRKQRLQEKHEELKRAKAAHEVSKAKKDQDRLEKARAAAEAASANAKYNLPECLVCSKSPDPQDFIICPLCQMLGDYYGLENEQPAIFCSRECHDEGYESHVNATHECASGQACVTLHDEDVEMDGNRSVPVFCRECVENAGIPSAFCSLRCFDANFQNHRDSVHVPERQRAQREVNDESLLEFDPEDKTRYRARKIGDHLITLDDAMSEWQQKTGAATI